MTTAKRLSLHRPAETQSHSTYTLNVIAEPFKINQAAKHIKKQCKIASQKVLEKAKSFQKYLGELSSMKLDYLLYYLLFRKTCSGGNQSGVCSPAL